MASALLLLSILRRTRDIGTGDALAIAMIAALLPMNAARVSLCCLHYAVCNLCFYSGFALLTFRGDGPSALARIIALGLFVLSFSTTSFVAFFPVVIAHRWWQVNGARFDRQQILAFTRSCLDLIALPAAYMWIRFTFFRPTGDYEHYNQMTLRGLLDVGDVLKGLTILFFGDGKIIPKRMESIALLPALWLSIAWVARRWRPDAIQARHLAFAMAGLAMILVGIYPYVAVGKVPAAVGLGLAA